MSLVKIGEIKSLFHYEAGFSKTPPTQSQNNEIIFLSDFFAEINNRSY